MVCKHLRTLEEELIAAGVRETYRGPVEFRKSREWVFFDCLLDRMAIRSRMAFDACVDGHDRLAGHNDQMGGFVCTQCGDGIMGLHRHYVRESTRVVQ